MANKKKLNPTSIQTNRFITVSVADRFTRPSSRL